MRNLHNKNPQREEKKIAASFQRVWNPNKNANFDYIPELINLFSFGLLMITDINQSRLSACINRSIFAMSEKCLKCGLMSHRK